MNIKWKKILESRIRHGHICGTCKWYGKNTLFTKKGGRAIFLNECMMAVGKTVKVPPYITSDDSPCTLLCDLWKEAPN